MEETVALFETAAKAHGQTILQGIQPSVEYVGHEKALPGLMSILMDNAIRYAPSGRISAALKGHELTITVLLPTPRH